MGQAYEGSEMYPDMLGDLQMKHEVFQACIAFRDIEPVGIIILEDKQQKWIDYMGYKPVHIKRCTVSPNMRWMWVGNLLLSTIKKIAFEDRWLDLIFWESNEASGLSFYAKNWAVFNMDSITHYNERMSPENNIIFFHHMIADPFLRSINYRYESGHGIVFVFCRNEDVKWMLESWNFLDAHEIENYINKISHK